MGRNVSDTENEVAYTRLPPNERAALIRLVKAGHFMSLADALRHGARKVIEEHKADLEAVPA